VELPAGDAENVSARVQGVAAMLYGRAAIPSVTLERQPLSASN